MLLTPGLLVAGVMGLAREGHKGQYFFIEQTFYWSAMLYPLLFLLFTFIALLLIGLKRPVLACLVQVLPVLIPVALLFATAATENW